MSVYLLQNKADNFTAVIWYLLFIKNIWIHKMKRLITIILLVHLVSACSTSYVVSSSSEESSAVEFNEFAKGKEAEINLVDETVFTAIDVFLSADSLYLVDSKSNIQRVIEKSVIIQKGFYIFSCFYSIFSI